MLELCRDARKNVCHDAHKKLCRDAKHILGSQLPVSDAGWSCEGRSIVNGLSDAHYCLAWTRGGTVVTRMVWYFGTAC